MAVVPAFVASHLPFAVAAVLLVALASFADSIDSVDHWAAEKDGISFKVSQLIEISYQVNLF